MRSWSSSGNKKRLNRRYLASQTQLAETQHPPTPAAASRSIIENVKEHTKPPPKLPKKFSFTKKLPKKPQTRRHRTRKKSRKPPATRGPVQSNPSRRRNAEFADDRTQEKLRSTWATT